MPHTDDIRAANDLLAGAFTEADLRSVAAGLDIELPQVQRFARIIREHAALLSELTEAQWRTVLETQALIAPLLEAVGEFLSGPTNAERRARRMRQLQAAAFGFRGTDAIICHLKGQGAWPFEQAETHR
jgi:hypothetical protein